MIPGISQTIIRLKQSRSVWNLSASYFAFFSTSLWAVLSIPIAVKYLDSKEIGLWAVASAFTGYLGWMDFGISHAIGRLIAPAVAEGDQDEINSWWTTANLALYAQALLLLGFGSVLVPFFIDLVGIEENLRDAAYWLFYSGVFIAATNLPLRGVPSLMTAQERFHWVPLVQGLVPWVGLVVFYLFLKDGWGVKSYTFALIAGQVVSWICYSILVRTGPNQPKWDRQGLNKQRFKRLFSFSGNLMVLGFIDTVTATLPTMLLARLGGLGMVPVYNFSSRGPMLASGLVSRTYQAFQPGWQRSFVAGNLEEFKRRHRTAGYLTLGSATCGAGATLAFNPMLVEFLAGGSYFAGSLATAWFAAGIISLPMGSYYQSLLTLSGSLGKAALFFSAKLLLAFAAALFAWFSFGMAGVAAVFALLPLVNGIYGYVAGTRRCGFKPNEVSPVVGLLTLLMILSTVVAGWVSDSLGDWTKSLWILGKEIHVPTMLGLAPSAFMIVLGMGIFLLGLTASRSKQAS